MFWCIACVLLNVAAVLAVILVLLYLYFKYSFKYWPQRGVPVLEPSFPFGDAKNIFQAKQNFGEILAEWYLLMKQKGEKHMGFYALCRPVYVPVEMDLIKNIMARDFNHFYDRGIYNNESDDPLSAHLFTMNGLNWKNMRNKLTPTFTSGKLKKMFHILVECSENLKNCLNEPANKAEPVNIRIVLAQYTTDIIGSCAFGINCNSFENADNDFARIGKKIFTGNLLLRIKMTIAMASPKIAEFFRFRVTDKEVESFYLRIVTETIEYREKNNIVRSDFMQMLMELKDKGTIENDEDGGGEDNEIIDSEHDGEKLTFNQVAAQAFVFFVAGYETSSTLMTFILYELAKNQDVQKKTRQNVLKVLKKYGGKITYDAIREMDYLQRVVQESLRMHPSIMMLQRECTKEYQVPDTDYVMEKGTMVMVPVYGVHYDPEYYPDPHRFDPDRFTEENKATRPDFAFLPFGEGPRICIGLRFAMLETKIGICRLLQNYNFTLSAKTKQPLQLNPVNFVAEAVGGIWLDVKKCTDAY